MNTIETQVIEAVARTIFTSGGGLGDELRSFISCVRIGKNHEKEASIRSKMVAAESRTIESQLIETFRDRYSQWGGGRKGGWREATETNLDR